jgi:hypothetical protein
MSKRRELEKKLLDIAARHTWTREDLSWLGSDEATGFSDYATAALELMQYYMIQEKSPTASDETTVISVDVLRDLLVRISLLNVLMQDQDISERDDAKVLMAQWHPDSNSIYEVMDQSLTGLTQILNALIDFGTLRLHHLAQRQQK